MFVLFLYEAFLFNYTFKYKKKNKCFSQKVHQMLVPQYCFHNKTLVVECFIFQEEKGKCYWTLCTEGNVIQDNTMMKALLHIHNHP